MRLLGRSKGLKAPETMEMTRDQLIAWLRRYYVSKILDPNHNLAGCWKQLDQVETIVDDALAREQPSDFIDFLVEKQGPVPPFGWQLLSRKEAFELILSFWEQYGMEPDLAQVQKSLDDEDARQRPYEYLVEKVRSRFKQAAAENRLPLPTSAGAAARGGGGPAASSGGRAGPGSPPPAHNSLQQQQPAARPGSHPHAPPSQATNHSGSTASGSAATALHSSDAASLRDSRSPDPRHNPRPTPSTLPAPLRQGKAYQKSPPASPLDGRAGSSGGGGEIAQLLEEVQVLKRTVQEQVDNHKRLIGLQREQQSVIDEFLASQESSQRQRKPRDDQASLLSDKQWHGSVADGQVNPAALSYDVLPSSQPRSQGIESWLGSLGLADYIEVFHRHEIDFHSAVLLDDGDLVRMGVAALGPRKTILRAIEDLQAASHTPPPALGYHRADRQPSSSPPPSGGHASAWSAHVDPASQRVYYHNFGTGESRWDAPPAFEHRTPPRGRSSPYYSAGARPVSPLDAHPYLRGSGEFLDDIL
ncbi:putative serine/threonine-protein kinase drkD [Diplonema papillatum]|nr:putative serine/threonine-protein kinase drkD [Diplonema papillatum]